MPEMKKKKLEKVHGYIFNIKLNSDKRDTETSISEIFDKVFESKVRQTVTKDRVAFLRLRAKHATAAGVGFDSSYYVSGRITTVINIDADAWFNMDNFEPDKVEIPQNMKANMRESRFVLVPSAHRLFLESNSDGVARTIALKFLFNALNSVVDTDEEVEVIIETERESFENIINANTVKKLELTVSKVNGDTTEDDIQWMDEQINASNARKILVSVEAPKGEGIEISTSKILNGMVGLASQNGHAKAHIVDEEGNRSVVNTNDYQKRFSIFHEKDMFIHKAADFVIGLYRSKKQ
jgi:hypothetical protein